MATVIPFTPSNDANFQFQATFDGTDYLVVITWNLYRFDYYVNVYTLQNSRVFSLPLIGSPPDSDISLTAGYFDTELVYRPSSGNFEII